MNLMKRVDRAYDVWESLPDDRRAQLFNRHTPLFAAGFIMGMRYGPKVKRERSLKNLTVPRRPPSLKTATIVCACGCAESFQAEYRTRRPKYMNEAHKQRAYRKRRAAKND